MAEKAKKDNKNIIIGACVAVVVVIIAVVAIVLGLKGGKPTLNDAYFVSDDTKYVLTIDTSDEEDESAPEKVHTVYTYSGDKITGAKVYYEYADAATAKSFVDTIKAETDSPDSVSVDGKYIIMVADESEYEDMTASDVKEQVEFYESLKNMNFDDIDYDDEDIDVDIEEDEE